MYDQTDSEDSQAENSSNQKKDTTILISDACDVSYCSFLDDSAGLSDAPKPEQQTPVALDAEAECNKTAHIDDIIIEPSQICRPVSNQRAGLNIKRPRMNSTVAAVDNMGETTPLKSHLKTKKMWASLFSADDDRESKKHSSEADKTTTILSPSSPPGQLHTIAETPPEQGGQSPRLKSCPRVNYL